MASDESENRLLVNETKLVHCTVQEHREKATRHIRQSFKQQQKKRRRGRIQRERQRGREENEQESNRIYLLLLSPLFLAVVQFSFFRSLLIVFPSLHYVCFALFFLSYSCRFFDVFLSTSFFSTSFLAHHSSPVFIHFGSFCAGFSVGFWFKRKRES